MIFELSSQDTSNSTFIFAFKSGDIGFRSVSYASLEQKLKAKREKVADKRHELDEYSTD